MSSQFVSRRTNACFYCCCCCYKQVQPATCVIMQSPRVQNMNTKSEYVQRHIWMLLCATHAILVAAAKWWAETHLDKNTCVSQLNVTRDAISRDLPLIVSSIHWAYGMKSKSTCKLICYLIALLLLSSWSWSSFHYFNYYLLVLLPIFIAALIIRVFNCASVRKR